QRRPHGGIPDRREQQPERSHEDAHGHRDDHPPARPDCERIRHERRVPRKGGPERIHRVACPDGNRRRRHGHVLPPPEVAVKQRRIPGLTFLTMDAEKLDFPNESFDLVTSLFGFQIFANPDVVAREAHRVLRPKGRIGVAVWSTAEKATALNAVVAAILEFAEPDETGDRPMPFELGGPGELTKLLADAGFGETQEERRTHLMAFKDADEYIQIMLEGTPLGHSIMEEDPPVQEKILG